MFLRPCQRRDPRSAAAAAIRAAQSAAPARPGPSRCPGRPRRSAAACRCRTAAASPAPRAGPRRSVRIVYSMLNRLCSLPRVTTSQDESTRRGSGGAGVGAPCRDRLRVVDVKGPRTRSAPATSGCSSGLQQVVAGPDHVDQRRPGVAPGLRRGRAERPAAAGSPDRERADPAGDQLDRQRQAVQPAAQLADGVRRARRRREAAAAARGPGPRTAAPRRTRRRPLARRRRTGSRAAAPSSTPRPDPEHHPAGDDDAGPGAGPSSRRRARRPRRARAPRRRARAAGACGQRRGDGLRQRPPGPVGTAGRGHRGDQAPAGGLRSSGTNVTGTAERCGGPPRPPAGSCPRRRPDQA